jgi:hypothetical protein
MPFDTIGCHTGPIQKFLGDVVAACRRSWNGAALTVNPVSVLRHKRPEFGLGISGVRKLAKTLHR